MNITELTVHELQDKLRKKEITVTEIIKAYTDKIKEKEKEIDAFITPLTEEATIKAEEIQAKIENGEITSEFAGIPIGIKDNICTKGIKTHTSKKQKTHII